MAANSARESVSLPKWHGYSLFRIILRANREVQQVNLTRQTDQRDQTLRRFNKNILRAERANRPAVLELSIPSTFSIYHHKCTGLMIICQRDFSPRELSLSPCPLRKLIIVHLRDQTGARRRMSATKR
jgi:hypothetical protein